MKKTLPLITLLFFVQLFFAQVNKESVALSWLAENFTNTKSNQSFDMQFSRSGPSGETFRYYHTINGVNVFESSVAVHVSNGNKVTYHSSTFKNNVETIDTTPALSEAEALQIAVSELNITGAITQKEIKLYVYNNNGVTILIYKVLTLSENLNGYWETIVDAKTGAVISTKDIAIYRKNPVSKKEEKDNECAPMMVDGTAFVYDTDPLTATLNTYGGNYVDGNDATNAQLDAARTSVTLLDIEQTGGNFRLRGPNVEIAELSNPSTGLFIQNSSAFNFNRNEQGFEAANCYYHIDKSMRYINNTLGISLQALNNGGVIRYDPHGVNGSDNSFYSGGTLVFGEGGVDDAEDADVILHELGHGIHDWLTNGNLSQVNGLSEGSGDYWANSYKRSLGQWTPADPSYYYVFGWDGHNPFFGGRDTNDTRTYPSGLTGSIHSDGEIWASVLMEIWEIVGKDKTDMAFLEGLAMTNSSTNQQQAAIAVRQAAIDMGYTCGEIDTFTDRFEARGYTLPSYTCSGGSCTISSITTSNISLCDDNGTPTNPSDDNFTVDVTVTFTNAPTTGTLNLTGDGTASVSVSGLTSPHTFVGVIMSADGGPINTTATFSAETTCSFTNSNAGTAPTSCSTPPPSCMVTNIVASNISICDDNGTPSNPADDVFSADITVTFSNAPATGNLDLTGDATASVPVTGLTTSTSHTFIGLISAADGTPIALAATFSADTACTFGVDSAGTAPTSCSTPPPSCMVTNIVASNISICDDNGTPSNPADDVFSADITVTFSNAPATGNLDLTGDATASVPVTGLASSTSHTFVGLLSAADGTPIALAATFSSDTTCTFGVDSAGTAPSSCSTLGVNEFENNKITLFPNPATEAINFTSITKEYVITIYNLLGQDVLEKTITENTSSINVASLPIGIYLVKIDGYNSIFKFVKK